MPIRGLIHPWPHDDFSWGRIFFFRGSFALTIFNGPMSLNFLCHYEHSSTSRILAVMQPITKTFGIVKNLVKGTEIATSLLVMLPICVLYAYVALKAFELWPLFTINDRRKASTALSLTENNLHLRNCRKVLKNLAYPEWLHHSCLYGHDVNLKLISDQLCDEEEINYRCSVDEETALHLACIHGNTSTVKILLSSGKFNFNLEDRNSQGLNALEVTSSPSTASLLIEHFGVGQIEILTAVINALKRDRWETASVLCKHWTVSNKEAKSAKLKKDINAGTKIWNRLREGRYSKSRSLGGMCILPCYRVQRTR